MIDRAVVASLVTEASRTNERRMLVLEGERTTTARALVETLSDLDIDIADWPAIDAPDGPWRAVERPSSLLGATVPGLVLDAHAGVRANTIGQTVGAVAGGGLVCVLIDKPDRYLDRTLERDGRFATPPYTPADVGRRFRRRFVDGLRAHRGIVIIDSEGEVVHDGRTGDTVPAPRRSAGGLTGTAFDAAILDRCLTADQRRCVVALEALASPESVVVVEAHRGRGKSSAAGLAAAGLASAGQHVVVTGPGFDSVREVFIRARETITETIEPTATGRMLSCARTAPIEYVRPHHLEASMDRADALLVDEAASLPVDRLRIGLEGAVPVAYLTTVHGYEGTGRGFAVRFHDHLNASDRPVTRIDLSEPIRYAPGDPIEIWQFRVLLLDATPPPTQVVTDARPSTVTYQTIDRDTLAADEAALRELFGLLVLAHYRTEPDDLIRLLDAPNVRIRALMYDDHPVSVALLAEEGGLDDAWRDRLYAGEAIRGHMIPDLLTTQMRDREAGIPSGWRVLRIATHEAVRSRGLGSHLLTKIHEEATDSVDYLGAGFGMTPDLLAFWEANGYRSIHVGTSRNPRSGEHSAVMLAPVSAAGARLLERHTERLLDRLEGQCSDALRDLTPETLVAVTGTIDGTLDVDLPAWVWDVIETTHNGPGQVTTAPHGFRRLVLTGLLDGITDDLDANQRTLLVARVLQGHPWSQLLAETGMTRGDARHALQSGIDHLARHYRSDAR